MGEGDKMNEINEIHERVAKAIVAAQKILANEYPEHKDAPEWLRGWEQFRNSDIAVRIPILVWIYGDPTSPRIISVELLNYGRIEKDPKRSWEYVNAMVFHPNVNNPIEDWETVRWDFSLEGQPSKR
jgi:hypothetical protein